MGVAVDLHCHILPGIDDGALDMDDAIAMAWQAQRDGIAHVCATPHIRHDHDVRITELPERLGQLQHEIDASGCGTQILPGGEVAVGALDGLDDDELRAVTLGGGGRWILLEPLPGPLDDRLDHAVSELGRRGYRAVIAHPERHGAPDLAERLRTLVANGALVQVTAAFLTDRAAADAMLALARAGIVHVLGSDAHSSRAGRPVALAAALAALATVEPTSSQLEWIADTAPRAIAAGHELSAPF